MRRIAIFGGVAAFCLCAAAGPASAQGAPVIGVSVAGLKSEAGQLIVCLWDRSKGFPNCREGDGVPRYTFPVTGQTMRVSLPLPHAGQYAVTVVHDENGNGKLNQNFIGMPTEGVGVSNNTGGMPRFNRSVVNLVPGDEITVQMRYLFK